MLTVKDSSGTHPDQVEQITPPRSKNQKLVDRRIDLFYKSTKSSHLKTRPTKRNIGNYEQTPNSGNDNFPYKQKTLSPWLIKGNTFGKTCHTPRRRRRRKPSTPKRSASSNDPDFRGATIWFNRPTTQDGQSNQLIITSCFSNTSHHKMLKTRKTHPHDSFSDSKSSSENEELQGDATFPIGLGKACASCNTKRTPLWRDAEDGTPLCNACGIRYRKYRVRCTQCWHIPKKSSKMYPICPLCGSYLKYSQNRKLS